jgi:poly(3-hydroxyalkanoate) synthetase
MNIPHVKLIFTPASLSMPCPPTNFLMTNPEVLKATIESKGENLVNGLENMLEDLERGDGNLRISMTDLDAFEVGKNLATTPGKSGVPERPDPVDPV